MPNPTLFGIFFSTIEMSDLHAVRVLIFQVGDLVCAVPAEVAREVLPAQPVTRIPGAPASVLGLINVRGTVLTVLDAHRLLGREPAEQSENGVVVLDTPAGRCGLRVGQVLDLVGIPSDALEDGRAMPGVDPRLVHAVGQWDRGHFVVLDAATLLAPILGGPPAGAGGGRHPEPRTA